MDTKLPYDVLDELEKVQNGTMRVDGDYKQAVENWFYQQSKEKGKTKMSKNLINYCKTEYYGDNDNEKTMVAAGILPSIVPCETPCTADLI